MHASSPFLFFPLSLVLCSSCLDARFRSVPSHPPLSHFVRVCVCVLLGRCVGVPAVLSVPRWLLGCVCVYVCETVIDAQVCKSSLLEPLNGGPEDVHKLHTP